MSENKHHKYLLLFFTYMGFSAGKSMPQINEDVKRNLLLLLVQVANYGFIPVRHQLLHVFIFCLLDSCFLSWVEQQEDDPWK